MMVPFSLLSSSYKLLLVSAAVIPLILLVTTTASSHIHSSSILLSPSPSVLHTAATSSLYDVHNLTAMTTAAASSLSSLALDSNLAPVSASSLSSAASFLPSFFTALCLIFMAELGDKTFLSTLFLSSALPASKSSLFNAASMTLMLGSNAAAATLAVLSAVLSSVSASVCTSWGLALLRSVASVACVGFGLQMLYDTYRETCNTQQPTAVHAINDKQTTSTAAPASAAPASPSSASSSTLALFLHTYLVSLATELGDHSQFSFLLLTSHPSTPSALPIVLGGVMGHVLCTVIAIVGGGWIVRRGWNEREIRWAGGGLFLAMALVQVGW